MIKHYLRSAILLLCIVAIVGCSARFDSDKTLMQSQAANNDTIKPHNSLTKTCDEQSSQTDTKMSDELKKALIGKAEDETVDVYIYLQSKNAEAAIMDKMKDRYPDLYLVYENDDESHSDLQIQLALEKHRELSEEYYQELSAPIIKKISQNGTVIFASSYTPMLIATLSQNSMVEILNEDSVIWMDVFIDLNTSIEDESNP